MKKRILKLVLIFMIIVNVSALIMLAYSRIKKRESFFIDPSIQASPACLQTELNLTPHQIQKMEKLRSSFKKNIDVLCKEIEKQNSLLFQELRKVEPDKTRINSLIDEISSLQAQIQKKTVSNLLEDKSVLTPHQRECYFNILERNVCGSEFKDCSQNNESEPSDCSSLIGKSKFF